MNHLEVSFLSLKSTALHEPVDLFEPQKKPTWGWGPHESLRSDVWSLVSPDLQRLEFNFQPIFNLETREIFAYEALLAYGGLKPDSWVETDMQLMRLFAAVDFRERLFVNLSNESILAMNEDLLMAAVRRNNVLIEWTETLCDAVTFERCATRISRWSKLGIRIVIDDFGAGADGFKRIVKVGNPYAIKLDMDFLKSCVRGTYGCEEIENLVKQQRAMNRLIIAEGIEDHEMLVFATGAGIGFGQGFLLDGKIQSPNAPYFLNSTGNT